MCYLNFLIIVDTYFVSQCVNSFEESSQSCWELLYSLMFACNDLQMLVSLDFMMLLTSSVSVSILSIWWLVYLVRVGHWSHLPSLYEDNKWFSCSDGYFMNLESLYLMKKMFKSEISSVDFSFNEDVVSSIFFLIYNVYFIWY